jgi:hypothetical protein
MEDVLSVSARPDDPARPVSCRDETSRQVLADVRPPLPPAPGCPPRQDPEYVRGGVANVFLVTEPLRGRREVLVGQQRTRLDWAWCVKHVADVCSPDAEMIVLVMDQRTTPSPASRSAAFPAAEAKRLADRLAIHHTPKHGSWRNMAERELVVLQRQCCSGSAAAAVLQRQCLAQRLPDHAALERAVSAWARRRNAAVSTMTWQFTTADARITRKRLYPTFEM